MDPLEVPGEGGVWNRRALMQEGLGAPEDLKLRKLRWTVTVKAAFQTLEGRVASSHPFGGL